MWNYAGGWRELFPSVNEACTFRGERIPFHGEVASLPWEQEVLADERRTRRGFDSGRTRARLRFASSGPSACAKAKRGRDRWHGERPVNGSGALRLGSPLRRSGPRSSSRAADSRSRPGRSSPPPSCGSRRRRGSSRVARGLAPAPLRGGGTVDLREIPGPEVGSHNDLYVTDLEEGWLTVFNPRLEPGLPGSSGITSCSGWIVLWQPFGGAVAPPLAGSYALGVEPWTSNTSLERSVAAGLASKPAGGASLSTTLRARLLSE